MWTRRAADAQDDATSLATRLGMSTGTIELSSIAGLWPEGSRVHLLVREAASLVPQQQPQQQQQQQVILDMGERATCELYCRCLALAHAQPSGCLTALLRLGDDARAGKERNALSAQQLSSAVVNRAVVSSAVVSSAAVSAKDTSASPTRRAQMVAAAFRRIDTNGDGHLSRAEVIIACRTDAEVRALLLGRLAAACKCSPRRPLLSPQVRALLGLPQHIRQEDGTREAFERVFQRFDVDDSKGIEMDEFMRVFADEGRIKSLEALDAMLAQPELTSASSTSSARAPSVVRPRDPPSIGCSQQ
jgi:Ca2+-binding EF-hand superfamily protein